MMLNDPKTPVDITAIIVAGFSWAQILPNLAALFSIVWMLIRIYETKTFRKCVTRLFKRNG
jgi:hypothetical protein